MRRMLFSRLLIVLVVGVAALGLIPPDAQDTSVFGKYRGFLFPRGDGQTTVVASANALKAKPNPPPNRKRKTTASRSSSSMNANWGKIPRR